VCGCYATRKGEVTRLSLAPAEGGPKRVAMHGGILSKARASSHFRGLLAHASRVLWLRFACFARRFAVLRARLRRASRSSLMSLIVSLFS
jgi:hypothetical protein